jgi:PAS domain S-box-containing protein
MTDIVGGSDFAALWAGSAWLFRSLAENLHQCVYVLDRDGRCVAANSAFARWLERPAAEIVGRSVVDLWPTVVAEGDAIEHERILQGERIDRQEERPRGGQALLVHLRKAPLRDDDGVVHGVLCLFEEVASEPGRAAAEQLAFTTVAPSSLEKTILLVEPDINLILLATRILRPHGFEVRAVREGRQAMQTYRQLQAKIDLVILEQNLPGPSGLETLNELLTIEPHLKVLLMSVAGRPQTSWWENTPGLGFLSKPYTADQLMQAVRELLQPDERPA